MPARPPLLLIALTALFGVVLFGGGGYGTLVYSVVPAIEVSLLSADWPDAESRLVSVNLQASYFGIEGATGHSISVIHELSTPEGTVRSGHLTHGFPPEFDENELFRYRAELHPGAVKTVRVIPWTPERTPLFSGLGSGAGPGLLWLAFWIGWALLLISYEMAIVEKRRWRNPPSVHVVAGPGTGVLVPGSGSRRKGLRPKSDVTASFRSHLRFFVFASGGLALSVVFLVYAAEVTTTGWARGWAVFYGLCLAIAGPTLVTATLRLRSPRLFLEFETEPEPGTALKVFWSCNRPPEELDRLTFWLEIKHSWTVNAAGEERTENETLFKEVVFQEVGQPLRSRGEFKLILPALSPERREHSEVRWDLTAEGIVQRWPDLRAEWRLFEKRL